MKDTPRAAAPLPREGPPPPAAMPNQCPTAPYLASSDTVHQPCMISWPPGVNQHLHASITLGLELTFGFSCRTLGVRVPR